MNKSLRAGRLGATYCWRIGGHPRLRFLQKRHYADRYTLDDMTQSQIKAMYKAPVDVDLPRENPWRNNYPEDLNDIGYESHCNDRVYMAKNKVRQSQQEYDLKRLERRLESQYRVQKHFDSDTAPGNSEMRKLNVIQDLSEHRQRQEDIIEMNRRMWQSRPHVKREINLSGITYRPDNHKHLIENVQQRARDLDRQRDLLRYQEKSQGEREAEAETDWWVRKQMGDGEGRAQAEDSVYQRRMKRLMGRYNADPEAEKESKSEDNLWAKKQMRKAEAEEEDWRMGGQDRGSGLQRRLMELMEAESKPEAEEEDWRVKSTKAEAEEEDWRVKSPKAEAEEEDWRIKRSTAEAVKNPWRMKSRRPEAEEEDWRVNSPRAEAEEEDWRMKSPRAEEDWRVRSRRPEAEEEDWRMRSPRAEAEEEDWRLKGWKKDGPVNSQSTGPSLQRRLMELMEAEQKPEAEEEDWRTQRPKAEAEDSPRSEAETQKEAEDKAWKARNLSLIYDPNRPAISGQKKRDQEQEAEYWHSWHTCPSSQEAETTVPLKNHPRRRKVTIRPPPYSSDGQRRSYHQTALNPQPQEVQPEPLANAPLMPKPLRAIPKKEKKSKPKRKRERRSVEPPRFKMTIRSSPLVARRPTPPVPNYLRRLNLLSKVAGPSFQMDNLHKTLLNASYAG